MLDFGIDFGGINCEMCTSISACFVLKNFINKL